MREEDFDEFRTGLIQSYGYDKLPLLQGLESAGLLSGNISWRAVHRLADTDWEKVMQLLVHRT